MPGTKLFDEQAAPARSSTVFVAFLAASGVVDVPRAAACCETDTSVAPPELGVTRIFGGDRVKVTARDVPHVVGASSRIYNLV